MICGADPGFAGPRVCGKPASVIVTVTGTGGAFDVPAQPQCERCARITERIVTTYYPTTGTFRTIPVTPVES